MIFAERTELTSPDGDTRYVGCKPLTVRRSDIEDAGVKAAVGSLQLVVDEQGVTEDWNVEFRNQSYSIIAIQPYLKRRLPRRVVLICELLNV